VTALVTIRADLGMKGFKLDQLLTWIISENLFKVKLDNLSGFQEPEHVQKSNISTFELFENAKTVQSQCFNF
jgi:hypothetical protein